MWALVRDAPLTLQELVGWTRPSVVELMVYGAQFCFSCVKAFSLNIS